VSAVTCSCGASYSRAAWRRLPLVGAVDPELLDAGEVAEQRNCRCGSTITLVRPDTFAPKRPLSERRRQLLELVIEYQRRAGRSPSLSELAEQLQVAGDGQIMAHLQTLERHGYVELGPARPGRRHIRVLRGPDGRRIVRTGRPGTLSARQQKMVRCLHEAGYTRYEIAALACVSYDVVQRIV